jgi:hypothetical protein
LKSKALPQVFKFPETKGHSNQFLYVSNVKRKIVKNKYEPVKKAVREFCLSELSVFVQFEFRI